MKRLPIIRHIRYFYLSWKLWVYIAWCQQVGIGLHPHESDLQYLQDVWDGKH